MKNLNRCTAVLIIVSLLPLMITAESNRSTTKNLLVKPRRYLTNKDKILQDIEMRESGSLAWAIKVLKYDTSKVHTLEEIYAHLKLLSQCNYGHIKLQNLTIKRGRARLPAVTSQGNYIPYMNISIGSYVQKPTIVIVGGIQGCDWLGVAAAMHIIEQFSLHFEEYYEYTNELTWIIIPVLNPDGYNVTVSDKEMRNWPKNMFKPNETQPSHKKNCFGVNLVRNFEYQWINYNYRNASWCDEYYTDKPFSQTESKALRDTITDHLDAIKICVSIGQKIRAFMYPFQYSYIKPLFWEHFEYIIKRAAGAAYERHKRFFNYGHVLKFLNRSAGTLDDWIKAHLGVNLAFTFKVSNWSDNNNDLSSKEIKWTNEEVFDALKVLGMTGIKFNEKDYLPSVDAGNCRKAHTFNVFVLFVAVVLF